MAEEPLWQTAIGYVMFGLGGVLGCVFLFRTHMVVNWFRAYVRDSEGMFETKGIYRWLKFMGAFWICVSAIALSAGLIHAIV